MNHQIAFANSQDTKLNIVDFKINLSHGYIKGR